MSAPERRLVTIVCPVFNEETSVPLFYERLVKAIEPMASKVRFELLFINNRSVDGTLDALMRLRETDPRLRIITMSRNFGYQASITAGMENAAGDAVCNIDVDCEDPPEMIPRFIERWLDGMDVVYGRRDKREEIIFMQLARKLFYRITRRVGDHEIILDMAEFFLVDRRVRDAALSTASTFPFVRGQVGFVGFKREGIPYKRERRIAGETHYNLLSATRFALAGILSSSTMVLRMIAYAGVAFLLTDVLAAIFVLVAGNMLHLDWPARILISFAALQVGWALLALGALGIYLARVYKDVMGLPLYVVDERLSYPRRDPDA